MDKLLVIGLILAFLGILAMIGALIYMFSSMNKTGAGQPAKSSNTIFFVLLGLSILLIVVGGIMGSLSK